MILNGVPWLLRHATGGRLLPPDYDLAEQWVIPPGGFAPPWWRALRNRGHAADADSVQEVPMHEAGVRGAPSPDPSKKGVEEEEKDVHHAEL